MAVAYRVNGPAIVKTGTGNAGALQQLGVSEDGVELVINEYREKVMSDVTGPRVPAELQEMGRDATVRMRLIACDLSVLQGILKRGDATAEGELPTIGAFSGTNSYAFRLLIDSALDTPYNFLTAVLLNGQKLKLGTVRTPIDLEFYAWAFVAATATSAKDAVLYNHTNS